MALKDRDPLAPVQFAFSAVLGVVGAMAVLTTLLTVWQPGPDSVSSGWRYQACVDVRNGTSVFVDGREAVVSATGDAPPAGTSVLGRVLEVCARSPRGSQVAWALAARLPGVLVPVGAMAYVLLLTRRARRRGIFSAEVAHGLRALGRFLVVAPLVALGLALFAGTRLLTTLIGSSAFFSDLSVEFPWGHLLTGFAVLTLGRVMLQGVEMRDELDATV